MNFSDDWTAETVEANDVHLQVYRGGDGSPLVLAHGFYDNGRCWGRLAIDFVNDSSGRYEVVAYDARAHGRSEAPKAGYAIEDRVADLVGVVDGLGLDDPVLLGHSMGATTIAAAAATHPELPRAIVLVDPAGMLADPPMGPEARATFVRERVDEWQTEPLARLTDDVLETHPGMTRDDARRCAVARSECRPEIAEIAREGYPEVAGYFDAIACPTLVLRADADPESRAADLDVAERLSDGHLVHVPEAGHCVIREEYRAATEEVRTFLRRL